jgi:YD repeat-containing protein
VKLLLARLLIKLLVIQPFPANVQAVMALWPASMLWAVIDPYEPPAFVPKDGVGNELSEKDRRGFTTSYTYDAISRPTGVRLPEPFHEPMIVTSYDDATNRKTVTDRRLIPTMTQTDALGRVLTVSRSAC